MSQPTVDAIKFESVSPVFHGSDVATALAFYCDGLGFKVAWNRGPVSDPLRTLSVRPRVPSLCA
jgi:hypothetical protein